MRNSCFPQETTSSPALPVREQVPELAPEPVQAPERAAALPRVREPVPASEARASFRSQ